MRKPTLECACADTRCPNHPTNHDFGCAPCVQKCLKRGEIPSCFFKAAAPDARPQSYYYEDFARLVLKESGEF